MSVEQNINARDAFTRYLTAAMTAHEAQEALFGHLYAEDKLVTPGALIEAAMAVSARFGVAEYKCLMQRFGISHTGELFLGLRRRFVGYCKAVMEYNLPPSAGFVEDKDEFTFKPRSQE